MLFKLLIRFSDIVNYEMQLHECTECNCRFYSKRLLVHLMSSFVYHSFYITSTWPWAKPLFQSLFSFCNKGKQKMWCGSNFNFNLMPRLVLTVWTVGGSAVSKDVHAVPARVCWLIRLCYRGCIVSSSILFSIRQSESAHVQHMICATIWCHPWPFTWKRWLFAGHEKDRKIPVRSRKRRQRISWHTQQRHSNKCVIFKWWMEKERSEDKGCIYFYCNKHISTICNSKNTSSFPCVTDVLQMFQAAETSLYMPSL